MNCLFATPDLAPIPNLTRSTAPDPSQRVNDMYPVALKPEGCTRINDIPFEEMGSVRLNGPISILILSSLGKIYRKGGRAFHQWATYTKSALKCGGFVAGMGSYSYSTMMVSDPP